MPTIIDELIIELGLDPTKFTKGQKEATESLRKFEREAEKSQKTVGRGTNQLTEAFASLEGRLLAIAGIFLGGMGVEQFTAHITKLTAETGYLAKSLGVSAKELSAWQGVGATVGATAGEMAASFAAIQRQMAAFQLGQGSQLNALAYATHQKGQGPPIELYNKDGSWKSPTEILMSMSRWAVAQPNKAVASQMLAQTGLGQGMIKTLLLGPKELEKRLKQFEEMGPSKEQVEKFQKLQESFAKAAAQAEKLGRDLEAMIAPNLITFLNNLADAIKRLDDWANGKLPPPPPQERPRAAVDPGAVWKGAKDWWEGDLSTGDAWKRFKNWWSAPAEPSVPLGDPPTTSSPPTAPVSPPASSTSPPSPAANAPSAAPAEKPGAGGGWWDSVKKWWHGTSLHPSDIPAPSNAPKATTEAWPTYNTGGGATGALAADRARFSKELQQKPWLRDKILRIAANEQGRNPKGTQSVLESMMNRASMRGTSLEKQARWYQSENGYYAQGNMGRGALENPRHRAILEKGLTAALEGSNVSNYATDNASGSLAARERMSGKFTYQSGYGGETFFSPGWGGGRGGPASRERYAEWRKRIGEGSASASRWGEGAAALPYGDLTLGAPTAGGTKVAQENMMLAQRARNADFQATLDQMAKQNIDQSVSTSIGNVHVHTQATDAIGISRDLRQGLLKSFDNVANANTGLQ